MISAEQSVERRFWQAAIVVMGVVGLATGVVRRPGFWSSYVLDMVGPAWNYILIRGLFAKGQTTPWSRFFSPTGAVCLVIAVCFLVEAAQYLGLYDAHYDPYDFLAYVSLVVPCYVIDVWLRRRG